MNKRREVRAALLGATGAVGQRYINMLPRHPYLRLEVLMGGESAGKKYGQAVHWQFADAIDPEMAEEVVKRATPESAKGCDIVFSALPSEVAAEVETKFAKAGFIVVSEASAHRMVPDVPLMIPEINPDHLGLLEGQEEEGLEGGNRNHAELHGHRALDGAQAADRRVRYEQGHSHHDAGPLGCRVPGVPSLSIQENVIPYIKNEEEKVAAEAKKILGTFSRGGIDPSPIAMGISCNRVAVIDGHMETLYADCKEAVTPEAAERSLERFRGEPQRLGLPTAPDQPIIVRKENDRPQPRLDRMAGSVPGMSVVVGRVRQGVDGKSVQLILLSHNTIRGAAGTAILTAELMDREGYLRN